MIINNITPPQVWSASARSLTNIGSGAIATVTLARSTLAAGANVDLRPSATQIGQLTVAAGTGVGATAAVNIVMTDGTLTQPLASSAAAASSNTAFTSYNNSSVGILVNNADGAHAGTYMYSGYLWQQ